MPWSFDDSAYSKQHVPIPAAAKEARQFEGKLVPRVGMEVVRTRFCKNFPDLDEDDPVVGIRGPITHVHDGYGRFHVEFPPPVGRVGYDFEQLGSVVVPAAEWDARKTDSVVIDRKSSITGIATDHAAKPAVCKAPITIDPPPWSGLGVSSATTVDWKNESYAWVGIASLAISLFELDMDEHACRVGEEGRGGIGKAAVLDRMVWRLSEEMREIYMWRAAIALKRATEHG